MHSSCSNNMPPLPQTSCCEAEGRPLGRTRIAIIGPGASGLLPLAALALAKASPQYDVVSLDMEPLPVEHAEPIARSHSFEGTYYPSADELIFLNTLERESKWDYAIKHTPLPVMLEKGWYDKPAPRPRHSSAFTKSQSSPKARKAARRRAKAGRKAAR
jgi:hypothetical protein